jgi:hypothetical protein
MGRGGMTRITDMITSLSDIVERRIHNLCCHRARGVRGLLFTCRVEAVPLASHKTGGGRAFPRESDADPFILVAGHFEAV